MKMWFGYGSEHSANLVIIGKFRTEEEASGTAQLLEILTDTVRDDEGRGQIKAGSESTRFSDALMKVFSDTNFSSFDHKDPEQLLYDYSIERTGRDLVITTDELTIEAILKILLHGNARVEVYSAHTYPGPHGRSTT